MTNKKQLNGLFAESNGQKANANSNSLTFTGQLTQTSQEVANEVLNTIAKNVEQYQAAVEESKKSHDAMDELLETATNLDDIDVSFLEDASDDEIERMIRSQQSKRSRTKGKVMTIDNYKTLLTAAVAENLLRIASGKPKSSGGGSRGTTVGYTEEELQKLADNEEELKKAIRNIQSKKCIMKNKADFDEESEQFKQILTVESQLKAIRDSGNTQAAKAVENQKKIEETLATVDFNNLGEEDSKKVLEQIKQMLLTK